MRTIQILGTGCAKCRTLADQAEKAARELGIPFEMTKVTDLAEISAFGVMSTPALVVNGEVKAMGKLPSLDEIKAWLK